MMLTPLRASICIAILFGSIASSQAQFGGIGRAIEKGVQDAGKAIEKGAHDAGRAIEKGVDDGGKSIEKGAHDAGKAIEKGADDAGKSIEKGAHDAGKAIEKGAHDIGNVFTVRPKKNDPNYPPYRILVKNPKCASFALDGAWKKYFAAPEGAVLGVQFRSAKKYVNDKALGSIDPAACYTVSYKQGRGFSSHRTFGYSRMYKPEYKDMRQMVGLAGDPEENELNVDGVPLFFNEGGEVYDKRGRIVGVMICYLSNECEAYAY